MRLDEYRAQLRRALIHHDGPMAGEEQQHLDRVIADRMENGVH